MRTLERALNSEMEDHAVALAMECAQTLHAYYRAARWQDGTAFNAWVVNVNAAWADHKSAERSFYDAFPGIADWRELVPEAVKKLEEVRP